MALGKDGTCHMSDRLRSLQFLDIFFESLIKSPFLGGACQTDGYLDELYNILHLFIAYR